MNFEMLFSSASLFASAGWVILIFFPRKWRWLNSIATKIIPIILSLGYSVLICRYFFFSAGGFDSLASVQQLFSTPSMALAGWIHYLAFDLIMGGIVARQSDQIKLSRLIQTPILLATFMFAPFGYLLFISTKKWAHFFNNRHQLSKR